MLFSALGVVNQQHHGISVSQERGTSDPESEREMAMLFNGVPRSLSAESACPPQSRVAALGIACSALLAGTGLSASHQSLKLARMLDEPAAPLLQKS